VSTRPLSLFELVLLSNQRLKFSFMSTLEKWTMIKTPLKIEQHKAIFLLLSNYIRTKLYTSAKQCWV